MISVSSSRAGTAGLAFVSIVATLSLGAFPLEAVPRGRAVDAAKTTAKGAAASGSLKPITSPVRLTYLYKPGDVRHFKVTGFFNGHFPPFATAGSPPIHLMTVLDYVVTVKKATDKGAVVDFNVENAALSLLEQEPGPDGKVDLKDAAEFPIPLAQVQKMFNATATIKPNGVVADIQGGDASSVKIDLGIDLRKLFLVTAPVAFADKPVKAGDDWSFDDGLLGNKAGKTTYTGRLQSLASGGKNTVATVTQQAQSTVDTKLDKEGNSTDNTANMVGSLVGKVTLDGTMKLACTSETSAPRVPDEAAGRVTDSKLSMIANLKRTLPDPDEPGKTQVTDIDIKARLFLQPIENSPHAGDHPARTGSQPPKNATRKGGSTAKAGKK